MTEEDQFNETMLLDLNAMSKEQTHLITGKYFFLTVIEGRDFGNVFYLEKNETIIGRKFDNENTQDTNDIGIDDDRASRRHVSIVKHKVSDQEDIYQIVATDLGSKNGTFLDDKRVVKEAMFVNGSKISIGNTVLKFEVKDSLDIPYQERLYNQVTRDPLTKLWNYHYVKQEINKLISLGETTQRIFSIILAEIDYFQTLNDTYSQEVGDKILKQCAQIILNNINSFAIAAKFSGAQYLIVLPETNIQVATNIAEQIRKQIETADLSAFLPQNISMTLSVIQFPLCGRNYEDLIKASDDTLYIAKQAGRNRVGVPEISTAKKAYAVQKIAKNLVRVLVLALIITGLVIYYPKLFPPKKIILSGLIEAQDVQIGSKIGGIVKEVLVEEGAIVKSGQLLIKLDTDELIQQQAAMKARMQQVEAQIEKLHNGYTPNELLAAEASVRRALARLEALRNGSRPQEIGQVQVDLDSANLEVKSAESSFARISDIYNQGLTSKQNYEDAESRVKLAKAKVENIQQKLSLIQSGNRVEDIRAAEEDYREALAKQKVLQQGSRSEDISEAVARLAEIKANLAQLEVQRLSAEVVAPNDGRIATISVRPGTIVAPGKPILKLLEKNLIWARIYVPATALGQIKIGQKANVYIDTFPNQAFEGQIVEVAEQGEFIPRNVQIRTEREYQVFGLKVLINNNKGEIKPGMSAEVNLEP